MMSINSPFSGNILKDIEDIYMLALEKGNFTVALKAKELLGRERGFFAPIHPSSKKEKIDLNDLSDDDISHLIEALEAKLKLDHHHCTA